MAKLSSYLRGSTTTTGISTSSNLVIGSDTSTGTADQNLQVSGGSYISGNTGIGSATPQAKLDVLGDSIVSGTSTASEFSLSSIDSSITDTAVDIFVYDTRKDSDGGAWRKRTQHTSWYNETLNTATRGARREFPAVAVIVAEATQVTIYDGDDPDLPMWITFPTADAKGVSALNGELCLSAVNSAPAYHSLLRINFIADQAINHRQNTAAVVQGYFRYTLSSTDLALLDNGSSSWTGYTSEVPNIVNGGCRDVAMTVLPNAPIDPSTGLPVPTIAVATDGGVSVIKDDGSVVDLTRSSGNQTTSYVDFNGDELIIQNSATTGTYYNVAIPSSDTANDDYNGNVFWAGGTPASRLQYGASEILTKKTHELVRSYNVGFDILRDYNLTTNGLVAYATTSYNTGWLHGSVKGAFLSDTDDTNVTAGSNLITSGDFSSSTGWTLGTGWTISGGKLNKTTTDNNTAYYTATGLTVGKAYTFSIDVDTLGSGDIYFYTLGQFSVSLPTTGTHSVTVVANSSTLDFGITGISGNGSVLDNASLTVGEPDRSVNNKGLQVFGTITKSAVAAGADLVGYSDFSASDYLLQPYNSALDFGTGDFSIMFWMKSSRTSSATYGNIVTWGQVGTQTYANSARHIFFQMNGNTTNTTLLLYYRTSVSGLTSFSGTTIPLNTWSFITLTRTGNTLNLYINGKIIESRSETGSFSPPSSANEYELKVGHSGPNYSYPASQESILLLRLSASAPSPEQILKIYDDEKMLHQENSKAVLYGSSDAVTALAYDEVNDLLHVGTSSGRSDFQGLRRINNTTTAVTTAISASNGLIAEQ